MENLDEWSGDAQRISRTVRVDDIDGLLAAVGEAADAMDHHPEIARDGEAVTFTLWTHSAGGVTELDIALAAHQRPRPRGQPRAARRERAAALGRGRAYRRGLGRGPHHDGAAQLPTPGQTTPARPAESTTGQSSPSRTEGRGAPTMNEPSTPRQDAGMIVAPDAEPGSIEPQPGKPAAPGMHESTDATDD